VPEPVGKIAGTSGEIPEWVGKGAGTASSCPAVSKGSKGLWQQMESDNRVYLNFLQLTLKPID
jgi:hypothetical protein